MQFNVDKRFIEVLNEQGASITWEQFRKSNDIRRAERASDPAAVLKKAKEAIRNDREVEAYREAYRKGLLTL
jgi:hypothetical protein